MKGVFLDGASNTPLDADVIRAMKPYLTAGFVGNSFSAHDFGIRSAEAIEHAREQVAEATKAKTSEIFFTSSATEGNNWVIKSIAQEQLKAGMKRPRIVCGSTEHSSVLNTCMSLKSLGFDVELIPALSDSRITLDNAKKYINKETCLVCVMAVNNETGVVNDADSIAAFARKKGATTLIDCTQAISLGGDSVEICKRYPHGDYFTFSGHKFYGPTGVGCMIMREGLDLEPLLCGGSQEQGKRGGTHNTAGIVGLGQAIENLHNTSCQPIFLDLFAHLVEKLNGIGKLNVIPTHMNIISVDFSQSIQVQNLASLLAMEGIAVSAGSACDTEHDDINGFNPSHVLKAMGLPEKVIRNTVRVSFNKYNTIKDIDRLFAAIKILIKENQVNEG